MGDPAGLHYRGAREIERLFLSGHEAKATSGRIVAA
jgi:hypothetical protein